MQDRRISIAPMLDWTDRHARYFLRLIAPHIVLYTEMITTGAILFGDRNYQLGFHAAEHPLALQLGGSDPQALAECAKIAVDYAYDEINLNIGCPSDRVKSGRFGACLMAQPALVAECVAAMRAVVNIPVTIKTRIGIDDQDSYPELCHFIQTVAAAGCEIFIIHARKAWLNGLSPKQNREIPPLRYDVVYQLKKDFPHLTIIINGGIKTPADVAVHLQNVDGVMIGREAYQNPYWLTAIESEYFAQDYSPAAREQIIQNLIVYTQNELNNGLRLPSITRHILGLFYGARGAALWRRYLSQHAHQAGAGVEVLQTALALVKDAARIE